MAKSNARRSRNAPWSRVETIGAATLYLGDCRAVMAALDPASVAAVVTDPPYELGFMGKAWDRERGVASDPVTWQHALALLTPGGHLAAFAGSRTYHRIACAIEDAGFEIRDQLMWLYGSGFPKSHDVAKAIDKSEAGVHRGRAGRAGHSFGQEYERQPKGAPVCDAAKAWDGYGTALKPAHEPIALARKSLAGTVAANVLAHGAGALNIDACRIDWQSSADAAAAAAAAAAQRVCRDHAGRQRWDGHGGAYLDPAGSLSTWDAKSHLGRWPANVLTDGSIEVVEAFPQSARDAIRFFYAPKAEASEREYGLGFSARLTGEQIKGRQAGSAGTLTAHSGVKNTARANYHPTVKPVDLMRWLCRLTARPGATVLDPFMGSGSTGMAALREGHAFVGIEQDPGYFDIACQRIAAAHDALERAPDLVRQVTTATQRIRSEQLSFI